MKFSQWNTKVLKVCVASLLVSTSFGSLASNVRVIGTGGDPALMSALSLFADLPRRIEFCAWRENLCRLNERDFITLKFLNDEVAGNRFPIELSFDGPLDSVVVNRSARQVKMPPTQLENFGIAQSVYIALLSYYESEGLGFESLYSPLFQSEWKFSARNLASLGRVVAVETGSFGQVLLEQDGQFVKNLNPLLLMSLHCLSSPRLSKAKVSDMASNGGVLLDLTWTCQGEALSARAWMGYGEDLQLEVRLFSIQPAQSLQLGTGKLCTEALST